MSSRAVVVALLAFALAACAAGCASKVSQSNYDKIQQGMTVAEVEGILGKGEVAASAGLAIGKVDLSTKTIVWKDGQKQITVIFGGDKVVSKTQTGL
jgi:outer membrane protein assembly factor BamE (lipoprotein component of BamABCDE complex)